MIYIMTTEMTPKIDDKGVAFSLRSRDYKDPQCVAYGVVTKGNGDAFINERTHTSLSVGGGEPGQGYPCVMTQKTVYENHSQDCRYKELGEVCQPVSATFGMGGNNQPLVGYVLADEKEVFDASRRHNYEPFGDICETVQAAYGTGGE